MSDIKILCGLCGEAIIAPKGTRDTALSREQQQGAHDRCIKEQQKIMQKHLTHPNAEFAAMISALVELHPELEATKAMTEYRNHEIAMMEELHETFPYLKQQKQKAEEAKEKAEEKEEPKVGRGAEED